MSTKKPCDGIAPGAQWLRRGAQAPTYEGTAASPHPSFRTYDARRTSDARLASPTASARQSASSRTSVYFSCRRA